MNLAFLLADSFNGHMGNWGAGWWILMMGMMVVLWGALIVGAIVLIRWIDAGHHRDRGPES